jgi:hypothetical protein
MYCIVQGLSPEFDPFDWSCSHSHFLRCYYVSGLRRMASAEECVRGNPVTTGGAQPAVAAVFESNFGPLSDTPSAPLTRNAVAFD